MNTSTPLKGKTILITRPLEQAEGLSKLIRDAGGMPLVFPVIEIKPPTDPARLDILLRRLGEFDLAIFISPTSVAWAWERITATCAWPESLQVAAVGQGSARALGECGIKNVITPAGQADSEALLAMSALQNVAGKSIVIFRGEGGRELLAETLTQRGAHVEYAECYRRTRPETDIAPLLQQQEYISAVVLFSRESLANFRKLLGAAWPQFKSLPVFVPHERIADACKEEGMDTVLLASGGNVGITQAMIEFFSHE